MFDATLLHLQFSAWGCSCPHAYLHTFKGHWYKQASSGQHHVSEEPDERFQPSITIDRFGLPRSDSRSLNTSRLCRSYFEPQRNTAKLLQEHLQFHVKLYINSDFMQTWDIYGIKCRCWRKQTGTLEYLNGDPRGTIIKTDSSSFNICSCGHPKGTVACYITHVWYHIAVEPLGVDEHG